MLCPLRNKHLTAILEVQSAMGKAAAAAVRAVWAQDGHDAARQLYQRMLALPPPGLAVFHAILDLEVASEASSPSKHGPARIQQTFEVCPRCLTLFCCLWVCHGPQVEPVAKQYP